VVLVAVAAVLVVLRPHSGAPASRSAGSSSSASSAGSGAPSPGAAPAGATPTPRDLESFVRGYYALLPGQPSRAWALLGDPARTASHGFAGYTNFYAGLASVSFAEPPTAVDGRTVRATLRFDPKSGGESVERYEFTVVAGPDGGLVMSSFARR
jgi:hypothetical protein